MNNAFDETTKTEQRSQEEAAYDAVIDEFTKNWRDTPPAFVVAYYLRSIRDLLRWMLVAFIVFGVLFLMVFTAGMPG